MGHLQLPVQTPEELMLRLSKTAAATTGLQADAAGMNVWLHPPYTRAGEFIQHYLGCKDRDPANTSAMIVLPKWKGQPWWPLIQGMRLIKEYPAGSRLFAS
jgi:hypothetical protein